MLVGSWFLTTLSTIFQFDRVSIGKDKSEFWQYFLRARSTLRHGIMLHINAYDWRYLILIYH